MLTKGRDNNLDIFRFILASLVVYSHSNWLLGYEDGSESLRVMMFFIISGFFISASYNRLNNIRDYFKARILRIFPGLILVVLFTVFLLGPFVSTLSFKEYFTHSETYGYLKTLLLFDIQYDLPGVFEENIYKGVVNGSIWTIFPEALYYIAAGSLGFTKMLNKKVIVFLFLLTHIVYFTNYPIESMYVGYFRYFLAGMLFYQFKKVIPLHLSLFILSIFALYVGHLVGYFTDLFVFFGTYIVFYFVYVPNLKIPFAKDLGNLSYGVFLYGFPIQQTILLYYGVGMTPIGNFLVSMPFAILFAAVSWKLVEERALAMKNKPILNNFSLYRNYKRKQLRKVG